MSRLLALLELTFTWAFAVSLWQASVKELKLKKHGYPPKSIFRRGLNILCRLVTNFERFDPVVWQKVIKLLSCSQRFYTTCPFHNEAGLRMSTAAEYCRILRNTAEYCGMPQNAAEYFADFLYLLALSH